MLRISYALPIIVVGLTATTPCPALAFERQWHAGGGLGLAWLSRTVTGRTPSGDVLSNSASGIGLGAEIHLTYGLNDQFNVLFELSGSPQVLHLPDDTTLTNRFAMLTGTTGIAYTLDVLRWVPYGGILVGASRISTSDGLLSSFGGKRGTEINLDLAVAGGLDYQITRDLAFGFAARWHLAPLANKSTHFTMLSLRAAYTWGF